MKIQRNKKNQIMKNRGFAAVGNNLEPLLKKGVKQGIFPAAAAGIYRYASGREKRLILTTGKTRNDAQGIPINKNTLFDLASLTKPLCSVLCILTLIEDNALQFEDRLATLLPNKLPPEYKEIRLDQLLSHSAGLQAYKPFYKEFSPVQRNRSTRKFIDKIVKEQLEYPPGSRCIYSDLGYILLGAVIKYVSGDELDIFFKREIAAKMGLQEKIMFRRFPLNNKKEVKTTAATEKCPWRDRILQGEVHDEHCWLLNGVAGHAGLFGTIEGVLSQGETILHVWQGRKQFKGFSRALLKKTLSRVYSDRTWCLGFDTPSTEGSSAGSLFSPQSVGHLGYTGTSLWIDPLRDIVAVLLTNRVHPTRDNKKIKAFRPFFHDAVITAFGEP